MQQASTRAHPRAKPAGWYGSAFAGLFYGLLVLLCYLAYLPLILLWLYTVCSLIAFILYWHDKSAAKQHAQRIPENWLQLLAVLGGWPGALIAQRLFHHKNKKRAFQIMFWLMVMLNIAAITSLFTQPGITVLRALAT